jgi:hypothetical protein
MFVQALFTDETVIAMEKNFGQNDICKNDHSEDWDGYIYISKESLGVGNRNA